MLFVNKCARAKKGPRFSQTQTRAGGGGTPLLVLAPASSNFFENLKHLTNTHPRLSTSLCQRYAQKFLTRLIRF